MSWFASKPKPVVEINRESADNTKDFASMDTAERVAHQLKFAGKWKRVSGEGIRDILEQIVKKLPPPKGNLDGNLKCLLVDSWYDTYLGVVILVRIIDGKLKKT